MRIVQALAAVVTVGLVQDTVLFSAVFSDPAWGRLPAGTFLMLSFCAGIVECSLAAAVVILPAFIWLSGRGRLTPWRAIGIGVAEGALWQAVMAMLGHGAHIRGIVIALAACAAGAFAGWAAWRGLERKARPDAA